MRTLTLAAVVVAAACAPTEDSGTWGLPLSDGLADHAGDGALAPPPGAFELVVGKLVPGDLARVSAIGANPGDVVLFVVAPGGVGDDVCPPSLRGACLQLEPSPQPLYLGWSEADANGYAELMFAVPSSLPPHLVPGFQAMVLQQDAAAVVSAPDAREVGLPTCAPSYDPVCGYDGMTYASACIADVAGVIVRHGGTCR